MKISNPEATVIETGGSSIVRYKPLFSRDSRFLLCPCGNTVKVFSVATGCCFKQLVGHENEVTSVQQHPSIILQVVTSAKDCTVRLWDYEDGLLLTTIKLASPVLSLLCNRLFPHFLFVALKQETKNELHKLNLNQQVLDENGCIKTVCLAKSLPEDVTDRVALSLKYLAVLYERRLAIYKDPSRYNKNKKSNRTKLRLTQSDPAFKSFACHPVEAMIATGHENGEMRFWHNIFDEPQIVSTQHWHSLEVLSLAFTPTGSSVLSGGHESVLVQWREEDKSFLPRLGCPISNIIVAQDNSLYACCHTENSITIVSSYFTIKQTIEGFAVSYNGLPCGLQYDEKSDACVTNGKPGHLLFYKPDADTQLYNLDVIGQNFISSADIEKPLSQTKIWKVSFCKAAERYIMVTLEFNRERSCDQKLKFWDFDEEEQQWIPNTVVTSPHAEKQVTSLCLDPNFVLCSTTARDGYCKLWCIEEDKWVCDTCLTFRDFPCLGSSFSEDGSLLALAFSQSVLLCNSENPDKLKLLMTHVEDIRHIKFGRQSCSHLLVVASMNSLQFWDILSNCLTWCIDLQGVKLLIRDPFSSNMAAVTQKNAVYIFTPDMHLPVCTYDLTWRVTGACFVPSKSSELSWCANSELYLVSDKMTVHKFAASNEELPRHDDLRTMLMSGDRNSSILSSTKASLQKEAENEYMSIQPKIKEEALSYVLNTPSHVLPPMSTLCDQFLTTLLLNGSSSTTTETLTSDTRAVQDMEMTDVTEESEKNAWKGIETESSGFFDSLAPYLKNVFASNDEQ